MKRRARAVIWLAIVAGGISGALAAAIGSPPDATPKTAPAAAAPATVAPAAAPAPVQSDPSPVASVTAPTASASTPALATALGSLPLPLPSSVEPPSAAAASSGKPREIPVAKPPPPPTSAEELKRTEILCYEKDPDQCQRAAVAHETGSAGVENAEQGKHFRKVALTFYVAQCERGFPHACFVLAGMYRSGNVVKQSDRTAEVLLDRALDLCRIRSAEECQLAGVL